MDPPRKGIFFDLVLTWQTRAWQVNKDCACRGECVTIAMEPWHTARVGASEESMSSDRRGVPDSKGSFVAWALLAFMARAGEERERREGGVSSGQRAELIAISK
jgi:hypothetical protein